MLQLLSAGVVIRGVFRQLVDRATARLLLVVSVLGVP
jgi:hypothetical protein